MATAAAVGVSLAAIGYLAVTDPKRRRTHRQDAVATRTAAGWTAALLPGLLLPFASGGGGFTVWLGTVATLGWLLVAMRPARLEALRVWIGRRSG